VILGMERLLRVYQQTQEDYSMFRRFTKKRAVVALCAIAALVVAAGAIAYFTASGSGTGQASVGKSAGVSVSVNSDTSGALVPDGTSSETLGYTVTNNASFAQAIGSTTVKVHDDGSGNITDGGKSVSGCLSTWFSATDAGASAAPATLAANGGKATGTVTVTMPANSTDNQDPCQGAHPDITVAANTK
jgi:hypothetical protein